MISEVEKLISTLGMSDRKARVLSLTITRALISRIVDMVSWLSGVAVNASRALASLVYSGRPFDLKKVITSDVIDTHELKSSTLAARISD
jgi:hypothetical protein